MDQYRRTLKLCLIPSRRSPRGPECGFSEEKKGGKLRGSSGANRRRFALRVRRTSSPGDAVIAIMQKNIMAMSMDNQQPPSNDEKIDENRTSGIPVLTQFTCAFPEHLSSFLHIETTVPRPQGNFHNGFKAGPAIRRRPIACGVGAWQREVGR